MVKAVRKARAHRNTHSVAAVLTRRNPGPNNTLPLLSPFLQPTPQEEKAVSSSLLPLVGLATLTTGALGALAYVQASGAGALLKPFERLSGSSKVSAPAPRAASPPPAAKAAAAGPAGTQKLAAPAKAKAASAPAPRASDSEGNSFVGTVLTAAGACARAAAFAYVCAHTRAIADAPRLLRMHASSQALPPPLWLASPLSATCCPLTRPRRPRPRRLRPLRPRLRPRW
jgi:hypothetical protein